eukprot:m.1981 g.1981  ORF g.1981 m.1981 type:complete len:329 (+) comp8130_c0_seq1:83-1069(+)
MAEDFFEATEKLLEVWFEEPIADKSSGSLRSIPRGEWDSLLRKVNCEIITEKHSTTMDSYILSESSMFVTDRRFILKTCGTTTLLRSLQAFLDLAKTQSGLTKIADVFYSRKNFMQPDLQKRPHGSFEQETVILDSLFPNGAAYSLGRLNGDAWYLYTLDRGAPGCLAPDQTLEILMTGLDRRAAESFWKSEFPDGNAATKAVGLADIFPSAETEAFMFEPCGYSLNGVLSDGDGVYYTVHVTPQESCSYASFETNAAKETYSDVIDKVVCIFKPERFLVTLFANSSSLCGNSLVAFDAVSGYSRQDRQFYEFRKQYNLTLAIYQKLS